MNIQVKDQGSLKAYLGPPPALLRQVMTPGVSGAGAPPPRPPWCPPEVPVEVVRWPELPGRPPSPLSLIHI